MRLVGHPEVIDEPWFADHTGRVEHQKELDRFIGGWIAEHSRDEVLAAFEAQQAVIGPIYSIADIFEDPQYLARETITTVDDPILGPARIQNAIPRLVDTPGRVRYLGGRLGQHNEEVLGKELGHQPAELERWLRDGVIGEA
jgi:crotonobetainyl-CoA:carnitine CoA-transferase CaiB-like acyl-CoA transferase